MTTTTTGGVLAYRSGPQAWDPPAGVVDHNGDPLEPGWTFFRPPAAEIGDLLSAHSTLKAGEAGWSALARVGLVLGILGLEAVLMAGVILAKGRAAEDAVLIAAGVGLFVAPVAALIAFRRTRFTRTCSYVGRDGAVRYTLRGSTSAEPAAKQLLFASATELRTKLTRVNTHGVYSHTDYRYAWVDARGKEVLRFGGHFRSHDDPPPKSHLYWFARAAEAAWTHHLMPAAMRQLATTGYVQFNRKGGNFVRVGPGFFEFGGARGDVARIEAAEIKSLFLADGTFHVEHVDARWYSRKGKFQMRYANLANAQLFLAVTERLTGYRVGG
ncbi:MAG TPA: hypothetical protein VF796_22655 [Humisphaera sp.]